MHIVVNSGVMSTFYFRNMYAHGMNQEKFGTQKNTILPFKARFQFVEEEDREFYNRILSYLGSGLLA